MKNSLSRAGLPNNERFSGIVSSLWMLGGSTGAYIGSVAGAKAFDDLGFEYGTMIEDGVLVICICVLTCFGIIRVCCGKI